MLVRKKKSRPLFALSFKSRRLASAATKRATMVKKKNMSISLADLGVAAIGASNPSTSVSSLFGAPVFSGVSPVCSSGSYDSSLLSKEVSPSMVVVTVPPPSEPAIVLVGSGSASPGSKPDDGVVAPERNYAALLKSSAQLRELGTPTEHVSGAPFVLIPDENIEAAKLEFKDFIYARFHGDHPSMGKIIGVVNAVWARTGPRIFVHNIGQGIYLLRVTNPKTREVLLSRTCWNIGGLPMFVAPWSPDYSPDEPPLTSAIVPVEMRNVPYLLFNQESLSRIATTIGKPESLAPETERKENFEVAKLYVKVDLTAPLPQKIVSGFSNGTEVQIDVSYPWLPAQCEVCRRFGHKKEKCTFGVVQGAREHQTVRKAVIETSRRRSQSRPSRSRAKIGKKEAPRYVPVIRPQNGEVTDDCAEVEVEVDPVITSPAEGEVEVISEPTQADEVTVLEDGEISQEKAEAAPLPVTLDVQEVLVKSKHISSQPDLAASVEVSKALEEGLEVVSPVSAVATDGSTPTLGVDANQAQQDIRAIKPKVVVNPPDTTSAADKDTTDSEPVAGDEGFSQPLPVVLTTDQDKDIDPPEDHENPFCLVKNRKSGRKAIPRGWNYFGNYGDNDSGRIVVVWDPRVTLVVYKASAQSVTCGINILSENVSFTVTFVYGFNLVEERGSLWVHLADLQATTPVSVHPWCVLGDFNQMLRSSHHSNHLVAHTDDSGMDEANIGLQDAQLFEAQSKGLPFTWRNCQDNNPISTKIDHAFINQPWSSSFPDSFADFLDPSQSDHAPCFFRMPAMRRQIIKPFKFFHHVIDHPEYAETVTEAWNCGQITGTDQYKLVRSMKLLKRPLRRLNKRHFSGISQRVKAQKEKVDELQRRLLTLPDGDTAHEEYLERDKLNTLLKAEEKYYKQRSRVRWASVGDRNTPFYHSMVTHHASGNHIHFLKDANDNLIYGVEEIKAHAADYFKGILGSTDLPVSSA
ncbi:hypothetical protein HID58_045981, partial [Brassica napus]